MTGNRLRTSYVYCNLIGTNLNLRRIFPSEIHVPCHVSLVSRSSGLSSMLLQVTSSTDCLSIKASSLRFLPLWTTVLLALVLPPIWWLSALWSPLCLAGFPFGRLPLASYWLPVCTPLWPSRRFAFIGPSNWNHHPQDLGSATDFWVTLYEFFYNCCLSDILYLWNWTGCWLRTRLSKYLF